MWIRTQNKQRIVNSDQIIDIFVDKTGNRVMAETTKEDVIALGEYKNRDTSLNVLETILCDLGGARFSAYDMPLGGEIK